MVTLDPGPAIGDLMLPNRLLVSVHRYVQGSTIPVPVTRGKASLETFGKTDLIHNAAAQTRRCWRIPVAVAERISNVSDEVRRDSVGVFKHQGFLIPSRRDRILIIGDTTVRIVARPGIRIAVVDEPDEQTVVVGEGMVDAGCQVVARELAGAVGAEVARAGPMSSAARLADGQYFTRP